MLPARSRKVSNEIVLYRAFHDFGNPCGLYVTTNGCAVYPACPTAGVPNDMHVATGKALLRRHDVRREPLRRLLQCVSQRAELRSRCMRLSNGDAQRLWQQRERVLHKFRD